MKIAYIAAGAGGMVCGSCIHDNALATALKARGEEVLLLPIYTPLRSDEPSVASERVFYGAINIFIEQKMPWFRHVPNFLHRLLDQPRLLRGIATSSSATDAHDLGALTLSMLQGEEGRQVREVRELVEWLSESFQPDVIHLAYSMLLGLAPALKRELGVPLLCSLQGEDLFLDQLDEGYKGRVFETLGSLSEHVDRFVATSDYYANYMAGYLGLAPEHISQARIGISLNGHRSPTEPLTVRTEGRLEIGYLARICPEKGLHVLCETFRKLSEALGRGRVRLRVAGYLGPRDRPYLEDCRRRLRGWGLEGDFQYLGQIDRDAKIRFLQSLDLLSVPTVYRESKGLFVLEAMANGVPVIQPDHGIFPELIERTRGGIVVEAGSVDALAEGILRLWRDPAERERLGRQGRDAVHRDYSADVMAQETLELYREVLDG